MADLSQGAADAQHVLEEGQGVGRGEVADAAAEPEDAQDLVRVPVSHATLRELQVIEPTNSFLSVPRSVQGQALAQCQGDNEASGLLTSSCSLDAADRGAALLAK